MYSGETATGGSLPRSEDTETGRRMADSSFDVVSKVDRQEVDNALNQAAKELSTRFDFRGTNATIDWSGERGHRAVSATEERLKAAVEVFKEKLVKPRHLDEGVRRRRPAGQSGKTYRVTGTLKQGIDSRERQEDRQDHPRRGPQGRQGADPGRRDPRQLQEARRPAGRQALLKGADLDVALQFVNYR